MDEESKIERRALFILLSLVWLPAGIIVTSALRDAPWPPPIFAWLSLVVVAPFGLPLALACRGVRRRGYPRTAWATFAVLALLTAVATLFAGLLGPIAIAVYAAVISGPAWILYAVLRRSRPVKQERLFSAFEKSRGHWLID